MRRHLFVGLIIPGFMSAMSAVPEISAGVQAQSKACCTPVILSLPGSTVAASMGGAYPLASLRSDVVFYNPALARGASGHVLSHARYGDAASLSSFVTGTSLNLTFGVQVLDYGVNIAAAPVTDELELPAGGLFRGGEVEGIVGYARTFKGFRLGGAAKWVQQWYGNNTEGTAAFDAGITANVLGELIASLAVHNFGNGPVVSGTDFDLPRREQLIVSTRSHELGPLDLEASGELHMTREDDLAGGLGLEVSYWPFGGLTFAGRAGARLGNKSLTLPGRIESPTVEHAVPTAGAGVQYKRFTFDYAWEPFKGAKDGHRLGLRVN